MTAGSRLAHRWQRIRTTPGLGRDLIRATVLVALALVALGWISANALTGLPWAPTKDVRVEFAAVPGLNPSASSPVTIAGVVSGRVVDAAPTDHGTAVLALRLDGDPTVYTNARAVLRPKNPLNEMSVELNPGGPPATELPPGAVIPATQTERPIQSDEVLDHLDSRSQAALSDLLAQSDVALARAPAELPGGIRATTSTLVALRPVLDSLQTRRDRIARLVSALSRIATAVGQNNERTTHLADAAQTSLAAFADNDTNVRSSLAQLPELSTRLRDALGSTSALTRQLNPTLDDLGVVSGTLPETLKRLRATTDDLSETIDALAPVVDRARPVAADLRPLASDLRSGFDNLRTVSEALPRITGTMLPYLTDLRGFVYNTKSLFGTGDALGGIVRGHAVAGPGGGVVPPRAGFVPGTRAGNDPPASAPLKGGH
jgi:phospholipid/cholesterol/gamma-HCH transport system substrate-binding protein